jgi:flagellar FliL protein
MTDVNVSEEEPEKRSKLPLILSMLACLIGVGGGFFASYSGLLFAKESAPIEGSKNIELEDLTDIAFVEITPIIVTLRPGSSSKHLSFRSQLEVPTAYQADVEHLLPRIVDIMNGYLSALETEDFESPAIIVRLRSQLLRRIQVVAGVDRVNDLLIMEFVLN